MVQYTKIHEHNLPYKQTKRRKYMIISFRCWKGLWQNPVTLHIKSLGEIRDTRPIPKHNKANTQPITNSKLNGEKLKAISWKSGIRYGNTLSPCLLIIILSYINRIIWKRSRDLNWKRRSQNIFICIWYVCIHKKTLETPLEI